MANLEVNLDGIINEISGKIQARPTYVRNVLDLLQNGATVPFIARYRKEKSGAMNEDEIRVVKDEYERLFELEQRKINVIKTIRMQDAFSSLDDKKKEAYEKKILEAKTLTEVEDLYRPYKPKRESKATKALKKGLGKLAKIIREEPQGTEEDRKKILAKFITPIDSKQKTSSEYTKIIKQIKESIKKEKDPKKLEKLKKALKDAESDKKKAIERESLVVKDENEALSGAIDIITEYISNDADIRKYVRQEVFEKAILVSKVDKKYEHLYLSKEERERQKELERQRQEEERRRQEELEQARLKAEEEKRKLRRMSPEQRKKYEEEKRRKAIEEYERKKKEEEDMLAKMSIKERIAYLKKKKEEAEKERQKKLEQDLLKKQKREIGDIIKEKKGKALSEDGNVDPLVYEMYFEYEELAKTMPPHRVLAINRGEREKVLNVSFKTPDDELLEWLKKQFIKKPDSLFLKEYVKAIRVAYRRILLSINRELRNEMTKRAEEHAIHVFAKNLYNLLMQPPLKERPILAIDPGYAHGCKIALIDSKGQYIDTESIVKDNIIYPTPGPKQNIPEAKRALLKIIKKYDVYTIAIGNGTASRETEAFVASLAKQEPRIKYCIVNEAGASVYSASKIAAEEFPDLSVEARGAISIARRLQDPLSELIKIDPKSIGVGLYQHDVNQVALKKQLDAVIEDCVNKVGVNVNIASYKLLEYVSGLNKTLARRIYEYTKKKPLKNREELKKIPGIGDKIFEQCAGFLKILNGDNPLDATPIHPESYWIVKGILDFIGFDENILKDPSKRPILVKEIKKIRPKELIKFMGKEIGMHTLKDIVLALLRPGRDPRDDLPPPILKSNILHAEDLKIGDILKGTVRNVVDFGAFVDIGLHDDGLIHKSEMKYLDGSGRYVHDPTEVLNVGDIIDVRVIGIDIRTVRKSGKEEKKVKIALSMYLDEDEKKSSHRPERKRKPKMTGYSQLEQQAVESGFIIRKKK
ncbi:MAG: Tex-like N-terminal domain-containing protein [Promethearchaeota archaeon]